MKLIRHSLAAFALCISLLAAGASLKQLPIRTVNGTEYHVYEVQSKETVYAICSKFGITKEDLVKYNPAVADGLKAGMTLFFPLDVKGSTPSQQMAEGRTVTHKVQKGETIFGIARSYGLTPDEIIELNPSVKQGLKSGQVLKLVAGTEVAEKPAASKPAEAAKPETAAPEFKTHEVKKKETFYSIAVANGISVTQLEAANPGISSLSAGQILRIPVVNHSEKEAAPPVAEVAPSAPEAVVAEEVVTPAPVKPTPLRIAVVLPFMLNETAVGKSAQRYTEFYKGMLLAVDSLRSADAPVHITAYDTEGSTEKVKKILAMPELKENTYIIAPDNAAQMGLIADFGKKNEVNVVNTFLVRDDSYLTNAAMMQANIPSGEMYAKAVNALVERLRYSVPVFVTVGDGAGDKADFTDEVKKALAAKGITWKEMRVNKLTKNDLADYSVDGNYTFIPTSSKQSDLNRIMPALIEWRDEAVTPTVRLFGYPEWTTFRGETLSNMHNLNTTVYSRFFAWDESPRTAAVEGRFKQWYGTGMESAVPRQGLLGFDTAMYLLKNRTAAAATGANGSATSANELPTVSLAPGQVKYDGVQNGFHFVKAQGGTGRYNDFLYLINFRPGTAVEKSQI